MNTQRVVLGPGRFMIEGIKSLDDAMVFLSEQACRQLELRAKHQDSQYTNLPIHPALIQELAYLYQDDLQKQEKQEKQEISREAWDKTIAREKLAVGAEFYERGYERGYKEGYEDGVEDQ